MCHRCRCRRKPVNIRAKRSLLDTKMSKEFDMKVVHNNFNAALCDEDDVDLNLYLASFEELNKFFTLLGTVFGFVSKDLKQKVDILYDFLKDSENENFSTVKRMIEYEKEKQLLHKKGYTSGSRTLLRLHRGLDFIRVFLYEVSKLEDHESTCQVCRQSYDRTLGNHHPFMIRKGAHLAMYTLPMKEQLLLKVCGNMENIKDTVDVLPKTLEVMEAIFNRTEALYTVHDLHSLP